MRSAKWKPDSEDYTLCASIYNDILEKAQLESQKVNQRWHELGLRARAAQGDAGKWWDLPHPAWSGRQTAVVAVSA